VSYYSWFVIGRTPEGERIYEVTCPDEWVGKRTMTYREMKRWRRSGGIQRDRGLRNKGRRF